MKKLFLLAAFVWLNPIFAQEYMDEYCESSGSFFTEIDFLYWNARIGDHPFVGLSTTTIIGENAPKEVTSAIDTSTIDFKWSPGVRAAIGYKGCSECAWQFTIEGCYLSNKSSKSLTLIPSVSSSELIYLIPLINPALAGNLVTSAKSAWELQFGTLDLLACKSVYQSPYLTLTPSIGLRAVWIEQTYRVDYFDTAYLAETPDLFGEHALTDLHSLYQAIGVKIGSEFEVPLYSNFSLVGLLSGSLVYGRCKIQSDINGYNLETNTEGDSVLGTLDTRLKDRFYQLSANFESELGLAYKRCYTSCEWTIACSYFFGIWFDQDRFTNFLFTSAPINDTQNFSSFPVFAEDSSNLQLHGLTLKTTILF